MKINRIVAIFLLVFAITITACTKTDQPIPEKPDVEQEEEQEPEEDPDEVLPKYEYFEGYTFMLDQNPSKETASYQYHVDSPQAKIVAISPDGTFIRDFLKENGKDIELGYDCSFQMIDEHLIIFARKLIPNQTDKSKKVTVINTKTLEYTQKEYALDGQVLVTAVNHEKAFLTDRGADLYVLDLATGEIEKVAEFIDTDPANGYAVYKDEVFMFNSWNGDNGSIDYFNVNNPDTSESIDVGEFIERISQVSEDMLLARGKTHNYLISLESKKIVKKFTADLSYLFLDNAVYDAKRNRLYVAGSSDDTRDKVFTFDLSLEQSERVVLFTIPESDLSRMKYKGNTKICINHDKDEMYVAYLSGKEMVPNSSGGETSIRVGYVGSISLTNPAPYTDTDTKMKIDNIIEFSHLYFNSKKM